VQHKVQEVVVLDRPALTKKLRNLLSEIALRVAGRNKDDATEALSIVPPHSHFIPAALLSFR
jgi:hypothetical protein